MMAQAMRMFNEQLREMMEKLLRGEQLSEEELRQLGQITGLNRMDDLRYRDWMAQRMKNAMQFDSVREAMREMMELMAQMGMNRERLEQMRQLIQANEQAHGGSDRSICRPPHCREQERTAAHGQQSRRSAGSPLWPALRR